MRSARLALLGALVAVKLSTSAMAGEARAPVSLTDTLLQYLGFSQSDRNAVLEKGGVLHSGLIKDKQFPEEVAAVGAMLLVSGAESNAVIDAFLHADTFHEVHMATRHRVLMPGRADASAFADVRFRSASDIAQIAGNPLKVLNLSRAESEAFRVAKDAPTAGDQLALAMRTVLAQRLAKFYLAGVPGITPYDRPSGTSIRPDRELESALISLAILDQEFPTFLRNLRNVQTPAGVASMYFRLEAPFQGDEVVSLSREVRQHFPDGAIGADLHFYASRGYNAMVTIVAVAPYDKRSLVFAINHTFTDQVTGFPAELKRTTARKEIAARLATHLETVRGKLKRESARSGCINPSSQGTARTRCLCQPATFRAPIIRNGRDEQCALAAAF